MKKLILITLLTFSSFIFAGKDGDIDRLFNINECSVKGGFYSYEEKVFEAYNISIEGTNDMYTIAYFKQEEDERFTFISGETITLPEPDSLLKGAHCVLIGGTYKISTGDLKVHHVTIDGPEHKKFDFVHLKQNMTDGKFETLYHD